MPDEDDDEGRNIPIELHILFEEITRAVKSRQLAIVRTRRKGTLEFVYLLSTLTPAPSGDGSYMLPLAEMLYIEGMHPAQVAEIRYMPPEGAVLLDDDVVADVEQITKVTKH